MTGSKQLANKLKSTPKSIYTRSKSVAQNAPTGSAQNNEMLMPAYTLNKNKIMRSFMLITLFKY